MGQKVNPHGLRVGINKDWDSRWYAGKYDFSDNLIEDYKMRTFLKKKLYPAGISKIVIERNIAGQVKVYIHCSKPGLVIGKGGAEIEKIKNSVMKIAGNKKQIALNIVEVKHPERDAQLVAENIAQQLENRISFRRAMKQSIRRAIDSGIKGIKTQVSGRLGGAEIARAEKYNEGNVPLQTLRADIDYGFAEAATTYGIIGVKVWINNGDILESKKNEVKREGKERFKSSGNTNFRRERG